MSSFWSLITFFSSGITIYSGNKLLASYVHIKKHYCMNCSVAKFSTLADTSNEVSSVITTTDWVLKWGFKAKYEIKPSNGLVGFDHYVLLLHILQTALVSCITQIANKKATYESWYIYFPFKQKCSRLSLTLYVLCKFCQIQQKQYYTCYFVKWCWNIALLKDRIE